MWRVLCDIERYAEWAPWTLHAWCSLGVAGRGLDLALARWLQTRRIASALDSIGRLTERGPGPMAVP